MIQQYHKSWQFLPIEFIIDSLINFNLAIIFVEIFNTKQCYTVMLSMVIRN